MSDKPGEGRPATEGPLNPTVWGRVVDATDRYIEQESLGSAPPPTVPDTIGNQFGIIKVTNETGADRRAGDCVTPDYATSPLTNLTNACRAFAGKTFSGSVPNQFAVLLQPMKYTGTPRALAPAVALGVCKAYVYVNDAAHRYARPPTDGTYVLQSCADGPVHVLYKQTGTGEKEALVAIEHGERDGLRGIATLTGIVCLPASSTASGQALQQSASKCTIRRIYNSTSAGPIFFNLGSTDYIWNSTPFYFGWAGTGGGWNQEVPVVMQDGIWMIDAQSMRRQFGQSGNTLLTVMSGTYTSNQVVFGAPGGNNNEWELPTNIDGFYNIDVRCKLTWGNSTATQFTSTVSLIHSVNGTLDSSTIDVPLPSQTAAGGPPAVATLPSTANKECTHRMRVNSVNLPAGVIYLTATCSQTSSMKTPETSVFVEQIRGTAW